ncbi:hypothetical protein SMICM17S_01734 [Streptomyces microflavus]
MAVCSWVAEVSVSHGGRAIGPAGRVLKPDTIKGGYQRVSLCATPRVWRISVHRLVLLRFPAALLRVAPVWPAT